MNRDELYALIRKWLGDPNGRRFREEDLDAALTLALEDYRGILLPTALKVPVLDPVLVPREYASIVSRGAAGYALKIRAYAVTEVFGKRPEDREALERQADELITQYLDKLNALAMTGTVNDYDPLPVTGWDD